MRNWYDIENEKKICGRENANSAWMMIDWQKLL